MARKTADIIREEISKLTQERDWAREKAANAFSIEAYKSYKFQVAVCTNRINELQRQLALVESGWGEITA